MVMWVADAALQGAASPIPMAGHRSLIWEGAPLQGHQRYAKRPWPKQPAV